MTVGSTNRIDAFLAVREAAARRLDVSTSAGRTQTQNPTGSLTGSVSARDHLLASQASQLPTKGQKIDFLA